MRHFHDARRRCGVAQIGEREKRVDARLDVLFTQRVDEERRGVTIAERSENHRQIAANARIVVLRTLIERRNLLLEIRDFLSFAALQRLRQLISGLPSLVRAARLDRIQIVMDRRFVIGEFPEEKKDRHGNDDDAEGKDDELKEDGARRFAGNVGVVAVFGFARRHQRPSRPN